LWAASAALLVALVPVLPLLARALPPCALHAWTGVPCVTCGSTRAALALAHGQVVAALEWNPLTALAAIALVIGGVVAPGWVALGGPLPRLDGPLPRAWRAAMWLALAAQWAYLIAARR
jgi:hypothetical protein